LVCSGIADGTARTCAMSQTLAEELTVNLLHSFLDRSSVPTWKYERAVRVAMEALLLVACAAPVVTGWKSLLAQTIVGTLRLHQAEVGREKASILSRPKEQGLIAEPMLIFSKRQRLALLDKREAIIAWVWPVLVPLVAAAETNAWTLVVGIGIVATIARIVFDKVVIPKWRTSRVGWRKANFKQRRAIVIGEVGGGKTDCGLDRMSPEWRAAFDRARERDARKAES
jgi:hypothetical protein